MIDRNSRYSTCKIYESSEAVYLGRRRDIDYSPSIDDNFHTITEGERLDLIAFKFFDKPELWWIIAEYNEIDFPLQMPEPGTILRIPSKERVYMEILK